MRCGILIVGSLLWDNGRREAWRRSRLRVGEKVYVKTPIRYRRRSQSRGDTFTMTFTPDDPPGQGVLVPCGVTIDDVKGLVAQAEFLWNAEQATPTAGSIGASWGCVGVLFSDKCVPDDWLSEWADFFRSKVSNPIPPVDADGVLHIPWPTTVADGALTDVDVILATVTKLNAASSRPQEVADTWIDQNRCYERYFFENVRHGIRTPEDGLIWQRIEEREPWWLSNPEYGDPVALLRAESATTLEAKG
jgi:hypothetical protein